LFVDYIIDAVDIAFERLLEEVRLGLGEGVRTTLFRAKHQELSHHAPSNVMLVALNDGVNFDIPRTVGGNQFNIHQPCVSRLSLSVDIEIRG
jgi:hypothetical protein